METINSPEQVAEFLEKQGLLRFKHDNTQLEGDIMDVIKTFFELNKSYATFDVTNLNYAQTTSGRRRTIGDMYRLIKYYRPEITLADLKDGLVASVRSLKLETFFCNDINKRVWRPSTHPQFYYIATDEFRMDYSAEVEKYAPPRCYMTDGEKYLKFLM